MMKLSHTLEARLPYLAGRTSATPNTDRRLATVRAGMETAGLDALIIYCGASSYALGACWLTNYEAFGGTVFVVVRRDGGITVTTDGVLHAEPMHSMVWTCRAADLRCAAGPVYGGAVDEVATLAADAVGSAVHVGLAGSAAIPQHLHATLVARLPGLQSADAVMAQARLIKSDAELDMMLAAGRIADAAFAAVFDALVPGAEDTEVAAAAVATMLRHGAIESVPHLCGRWQAGRAQALVSPQA